jgi:hypothetical protein
VTNKLNEKTIQSGKRAVSTMMKIYGFNYTVPEYKKYLNAEYQYLLEGFQDD